MKWVAGFEHDQVLKIKEKSGAKNPNSQHGGGKIFSKSWGWKASINSRVVDQIKDENKDTYWGTGRAQTPGDFILIDFKTQIEVNGISLKLGERYYSYPRGYLLEGSIDGRNWFLINQEDSYSPPIQVFLNPGSISCPIHFSPVRTRFLRMTNTQWDQSEWAISEFEIFTPKP